MNDNQSIDDLLENNALQTAIPANGENRNEKPKRLTVFGVEFIYLALLGIIVSFIGWVTENIVKLVSAQTIDSRFHTLPFISPYALIVFAVHILLKSPDDLCFFGIRIFKTRSTKSKILSNVCSLLLIYFFVFFGELAIGNLWGEIFGVELWNYSSLPLSVTQYAGLIPTLGYGTGAYLLFKFAYLPALNFVRNKVNFKVAKVIVLTLGTAIVLDTLLLVLQIIFLGEATLLWQIKF